MAVTKAKLSYIDGITATTDEINILDGLTATTAAAFESTGKEMESK